MSCVSVAWSTNFSVLSRLRLELKEKLPFPIYSTHAPFFFFFIFPMRKSWKGVTSVDSFFFPACVSGKKKGLTSATRSNMLLKLPFYKLADNKLPILSKILCHYEIMVDVRKQQVEIKTLLSCKHSSNWIQNSIAGKC